MAGTLPSQELGGRYGVESRGSAFSCTPSQQQGSTQLFQHRKMWYYAGFEGGGALPHLSGAWLSLYLLNRSTCTAGTLT